MVTSLDPQTFTPQAIANTANAYVRAGLLHDSTLFEYLAEACLQQRARDFSLPSISLILNALACTHEHMDTAPRKQALHKTCDDDKSTSAHLTLEAQTDTIPAENSLVENKPEDEFEHKSPTENQQSEVNAGERGRSQRSALKTESPQWLVDVFDHLTCALLETCIAAFQPRESALVANALARVAYTNEALLEHIACAVKGMQIEALAPLDVANLANSYARLQYRDLDFLSHLARAAEASRAGHSAQVCVLYIHHVST